MLYNLILNSDSLLIGAKKKKTENVTVGACIVGADFSIPLDVDHLVQ